MNPEQASSESNRKEILIKPVLRRLLIPLTAALLLLVGSFCLILVNTYKSNLDQSNEQVLKRASDGLAKALIGQSEALTAIEGVVLRDSYVRQALKEQNRESLLASYAGVFAQLRQDHGLTHFYFHNPNLMTLLRMHNPEKYGDPVDRFTASEAKRSGKTTLGIELGRLGTFTLRVVQPILDAGMVIGYLELGKEIEDILVGIYDEHGVELAVAIDKNALDRAKWEKGMKMLGREADWDRFPGKVMIYSSMTPFPPEFEQYVSEAGHTHGEMAAETKFNDESWCIMASPLKDASGARVGELIVMNNVSEAKTAFYKLIGMTTAGALALLTALIVFLYAALQRTDQGIRKQQGDLRKSEQFQRTVSDTSPDFIFSLDTTGSIQTVNRVHPDHREEDVVGQKTAMFVSPEYRKAFEKTFRDAVDTGQLQSMEAMVDFPAARNYFLVRLNPVSSPDKEKSVILFATDITSIKQAENALRESEEKYRSMMEAMIEPAYICTPDFHISYMNPAMIKRTGDDVTGEHCYKALNDLNAKCPWCVHDRVQKGESLEVVIVSPKDRRSFHISNSPIFHRDGSISKMTIYRDITERMQAEEAQRKSEKRYKRILKNSLVGIFQVEREGKFIMVNQKLAEMLGYDSAESFMSSGVNVESLYVNPDERYEIVKEINEEGFLYGKEICFKRKTGEPFWIKYHVGVLKEEGETIYEGIVEDITKEKTLMEHLERAQKMEAIGILAGGVAHDLNNILGGLVSYPELLLLQLPEDSPLRKSILTIQKSGEKAAAVVQDLLTLARRGVVVNEVVNLNDVIGEYIESPEYEKLQSHYPALHLEAHLQKDVLNILGSSTHLSKTVMNLVSNAVEAMPEGGKLTVSTENRYIDRPIKGYDDVKEGDYAVITISDTGTGISPDDIEKIFEPFYTKKKMGRSGTGLGMAVVWGTVKDHKGYIDIQSIEGEGTSFFLFFPVTRKKLPENQSHLPIESYSGKGESILIVDDIETQRNIASGMLMELGYSVLSVSSGEEAVEYLRINKVDLLILDMIMDPGMDGFDTYKKIIETRPGQKAIICSGFSETDRVKELQRLGAGAYIRKPLLLERIGLAVKEELKE